EYAMLNAQNNAITTNDGLTLVIDPANPGSGFGVALSSVPMNSFINGDSSAGAWIPVAQAAAPPYLALQSPVYSVATTGIQPDTVTLNVSVPPTVGDLDIVDLYGWDNERGEWEFVPAHRDGTTALI